MRSKTKVSRPGHSISPQHPSSFKRRRFTSRFHSPVNASSNSEENRDMELLKLIKCAKCNEGGNLVFCDGNDCPFAVHEQCVGIDFWVDEFGKFYCPYCWYKCELSKAIELRKKISLKNEALWAFLNLKPGGADGGCCGGSAGGKENNGEENGEGVLINDGGGIGDDDIAIEKKSVESGEGVDGNGNVSLLFKEGKCSEGLVGRDDARAGENKSVQEEDVVETDRSNDVVEGDKVVELLCLADDKDDVHSQEERMEDVGLNANDCNENIFEKHGNELDRSNELVEHNSADALSPVVHDENGACGSLEERNEDIGLNVNDGDENICDKNEDRTFEEDHGQADDHDELDETVVEEDKQVETDVLSNREDSSPKVDEIISDSDSEPLAVHQTQFDQRSKYSMRPRYISPQILSAQPKMSKKKSNQKKKVSPSTEPRGSQESPKEFTNSKSLSKKLRKSEEPPKKRRNLNKVGPSKKPRKSQQSPLKFSKLKFDAGKRKRLLWKAEEEEMLKEGLHKLSSTVNKNIPWRKILEFGRHVFNSTRTPEDLKDKWRNLMAKEF